MMGKRKENKMSLYDLAKDAVSLASKLQNIDLINLLIDIQRNALELQQQLAQVNEKNQTLKSKIKEFEEIRDQEIDVEEHPIQPYVTFKSDPKKIKYCANCWHSEKKKTRFIIKRKYKKVKVRCPKCRTRFWDKYKTFCKKHDRSTEEVSSTE